MTPAQETKARELWETRPDLTAEAIGERYGMSRNAIIGIAHRRRWAMRGNPHEPEPETLFDRMDALERKVNAALAATVGVGKIAP